MTSDALVVDVSQDWAAACAVQQRFMRGWDRAPRALDYNARCRQLHALGGDCYDFVHFAGDHLALAVGDASGKGLAAALMITSVQSSLRTAAAFNPNDLAATLEAVNHHAHASSHGNRYATLFYGVFDRAELTLRYVNAGHHPPTVIRRDRPAVSLPATGPPVGLFPGSAYEERTVSLHPGDLLLAYTDGVIEAVNPAGEEWGVKGLRRAAAETGARCAEDVVDDIFASMDAFTHGRQTDDATVLALWLHSA